LVIKDGDATWRPVVDVNLIALLALLAIWSIVKARMMKRI